MLRPSYGIQTIRTAKLATCRASRAGAKRVEPEHLLLALLGPSAILTRVLMEVGIEPREIRLRARELAQATRLVLRSKPRLSSRLETILMTAETEARSSGDSVIHPRHLLLALMREGGAATQFLIERQITYEVVRRAIRKVLNVPPPRRCPKCGYDLRATPDRCPECGTIV